MRSVVFALALLHAVAGLGQISISDEIASEPLQIRAVPLSLAAPAVALAKDKSGVAIAWTMATGSDLVDRISVSRLDASGHGAGEVREIPLSAPGPAHQAYPSLAPAPDGNGFVLAWMELNRDDGSRARIVFCRLDAALTPSAPSTLFAAVPPLAPPIVRTKGATTWIAGGGFLWSMAPDGTTTGPTGGLLASDMTIADNLPQLVGIRTFKSQSYTCNPTLGCLVLDGPFKGYCFDQCRIYGTDYELDFTAPFTTSQSKTLKFATDAQPAIDSSGNDVLVAWFRGADVSGGDVVMARLGLGELARFADAADHPSVLAQFPPDAGATRPAVATDGQRYVVVWRVRTAPGNHDIVGMAIDNDGKMTPLSIATSSAEERDPSILYVGGGTYLVAYEKVSGLERRIAGRFVTFGRRRATR